MRRVVRIHEGLEAGSPPLRNRVCDLPLIVDTLAGELGPRRRQALVETRFETFDFVLVVVKVVAWSSDIERVSYTSSEEGERWMRCDIQLEKSVGNLQH